MDGEATTGLPSALRGYERAAVEEFFERAGAKRTRLEAVIAEASARRERALAARVRNEAIAQDARREIEEIRADAEARATQILAEATHEGQLVVRAAHEYAEAAVRSSTVIDLRESANGDRDHGEPAFAVSADASGA